ncbi:gephyrin-like molybdotransferase Glp [Microbacterium sp. Gd 4-13]|uniref:molybdopterin molybdotransferase MoeA n=1 Tax=Microbacterium sp. Gd 4-13 TaxID=2173179 RepID=UPI0032046F24
MVMRTVAEHRAQVLGAVRRVPETEVPLAVAAGRTLAADVVTALDLPLWDNAAMDGFAVRFADVRAASPDLPVSLRVVADVPAGSDADPPLREGEAARIMTGAPVPTAADTVVPFEATRSGLADSLSGTTVVTAPRARGAHVRRRADDIAVGDVVLPAGERLGAWQMGAAAAAGVSAVRVTRAPRVAVVSTGDELRPLGSALRRGQIPESNATLLANLVAEADADVVLRESVGDEAGAFLAVLDRARAAGADVVVTSGGVSAGAFEVVKIALGGADSIRFVSVAMQPGRPQAFGTLPGGALFFGLPGNPVGVAVSFELFVRPALLRLQGRAGLDRPMLRLPAASGWRTPPARRQYVPVRVIRDDPAQWTVTTVVAEGSGAHRAGALGRADAYAVVEPGSPDVAPGDLVDVMLLS